jgi:hypothetical protein
MWIPGQRHCSKGYAAALRADAIGVLALFAAMLGCSTVPTAGLWYQDDALALSADARDRLGGALTSDEAESIKQLSRAEVERAFSGLRITVTTHQKAFWRVAVVQSLAARRSQNRINLPAAGESVAMGFLGGTGAVDADMVATEALYYAPPETSRYIIIQGVGRGIGRVAVHEFMHQMLGAWAAHNNSDLNSYEYGRPDRPSQYYAELHWTTAWPLLVKKFGK